jgi:hypothetical protein
MQAGGETLRWLAGVRKSFYQLVLILLSNHVFWLPFLDTLPQPFSSNLFLRPYVVSHHAYAIEILHCHNQEEAIQSC